MTSIHVGVEGDQLAIRVDMAEVARELGRRLEECEQASERARQRWEESEWYLGEARATIAHLETQVQAEAEAYAGLEAIHQVTSTRLVEAELQRDEAMRQLDESQRAHQDSSVELPSSKIGSPPPRPSRRPQSSSWQNTKTGSRPGRRFLRPSARSFRRSRPPSNAGARRGSVGPTSRWSSSGPMARCSSAVPFGTSRAPAWDSTASSSRAARLSFSGSLSIPKAGSGRSRRSRACPGCDRTSRAGATRAGAS
jgi:hypothetical protein